MDEITCMQTQSRFAPRLSWLARTAHLSVGRTAPACCGQMLCLTVSEYGHASTAAQLSYKASLNIARTGYFQHMINTC